jgi:hypothetical protein
MTVTRVERLYPNFDARVRALEDLVDRHERTPETKRTLVNVNEIRGKSFSHIIEDEFAFILANDVTQDYYRMCYIVPGVNKLHGMGLIDGHVTDDGGWSMGGRLPMLEGSPLQIEKIGYEVDVHYVATRTHGDSVTDSYSLCCDPDTCHVVMANWYGGQGTRQLPGNLMFIKCGSFDDAYVAATVDGLALGLPETKCEAGFNEAQKEVERRDWRGEYADFTIWDTDYDSKVAWEQEMWLTKNNVRCKISSEV